MIGYIKGKILLANDGEVLIENNGIGYEIMCSNSVYSRLIVGEVCELYTYMAVKEDGVYLYGFDSLEEKAMFLKLITVSGVGPKMGITVLSGMSLHDLAVIIATGDIKGLSSIKGLGKKTAEHIIVELREKITACIKAEDVVKPKTVQTAKVNEDALIALMGLGLTKAEGVQILVEAQESGATSVEELISYALRNGR